VSTHSTMAVTDIGLRTLRVDRAYRNSTGHTDREVHTGAPAAYGSLDRYVRIPARLSQTLFAHRNGARTGTVHADRAITNLPRRRR
jgi:hypothetical protein